MEFTLEQKEAIDARDGQILVSAAAGSGKTAVLVRRILTLLVEEKVDIDRLLVVTFTEAAAAEMKERVGNALAEQLEKSPADQNLLRQSSRLPAANISTIHAFCLHLVRDYFHLIDLDPTFRVGDQAELNLLQSQVMESLFEESYADNPDFGALVETFGGGKTRDIRLDELIRRLFDFVESQPFPEESVRAYIDMFDTPSRWFEIIKEEIARVLDAASAAVDRACELCRMPGGPEKYLLTFHEDEALLRHLRGSLDGGFKEIYEAFSAFKFDTIYTYRGKEKDGIDEDLRLRVKGLRDKDVKKRIERVRSRFLFANPEKMQSDIIRLRPVVEALLGLTMDYRSRYSAEKRARNLVDFNDLEHYAIQILSSPVAATLSSKYAEVLIDEYQDTNEKQEWILSAIVSKRRFMVGDVKQSIYGFRHAKPKLFMEKLQNPDVRAIKLSKNFRSRPEVLDAVNFFFQRLIGEIDLFPGREFLDQEFLDREFLAGGFKAELHVTDQDEAAMIAERIRKLDVKHGDIVVLTRSLRASGLTEELKQHGIHAVAETPGGFFETPEIMIALSLLRVVDNPRQDIDLLAVMRLYDFTADDMLALRVLRDGDYYECLLASDSERVTGLLSDIDRWRKKAQILPISRLIGVLYEETGIFYRFGEMPGGAVRQANLRLLLEKAIAYENTSFSGLFHFMRYVEWLQTNESDEAAAMVLPEADDIVRVMTIHKAKGLEFPVVFVSRLGGQFNRIDERTGVILHPDLGIGTMYTDLEERTRSNTVPRLALSLLKQRESVAEELRVLYVALTRAKEKLILTGWASDLEKWQDPLYDLHEGKCYLDWLMPYALESQEAIEVKFHTSPFPQVPPLEITGAKGTGHGRAAPEGVQEQSPHGLPSKLAISELKRIYALEASPESELVYEEDMFEAPLFYGGEYVTPMRMGTVLHTVIEHMDLNDSDIESLVESLVGRGLLTREEAGAVDIKRIIRFANSPLAERMRNAVQLHREIPFVVGLSPDEVYGSGLSEDTILVHGIIDCYFETADGEIILVDFKTGSQKMLEERYATQMKIYRRAIEAATGKAVSEALIYAL